MSYKHYTVLKKEAIELLVHNPNGIYVDATCGGGGHSEELLTIFPYARLVACDWDMKALEATEKRLARFGNRAMINYGSLAHLYRLLKKLGIPAVDGILADFGTSRNQIESSPGFSFMHDTELDMRMSVGHQRITAADIIARSSEKELIKILQTYGEEHYARRIVSAICEEREIRRITTTLHLAQLVKKSAPYTAKRINPATKTFQALRIAVNKELEQIENFLGSVPALLKENGRLVTISFHSLEDRLVKTFVKSHKNDFIDIIGGIMVASDEELAQNPPSRSAKMRAVQKRAAIAC